MKAKKIDGIRTRRVSMAPRNNQTAKTVRPIRNVSGQGKNQTTDPKRRMFLNLAGLTGLGILTALLLPKKANALVLGSSPTTGIVGLKNATNVRINPATEETLATLLQGQGVQKFTVTLAASGNVLAPTSGKKIRIYSTRFSLTADLTSVSFRFTAGGTDYEKYVSPKVGGLYGANNHPNFIEGGVNQPIYCTIAGSATVQINIDYLEI